MTQSYNSDDDLKIIFNLSTKYANAFHLLYKIILDKNSKISNFYRIWLGYHYSPYISNYLFIKYSKSEKITIIELSKFLELNKTTAKNYIELALSLKFLEKCEDNGSRKKYIVTTKFFHEYCLFISILNQIILSEVWPSKAPKHDADHDKSEEGVNGSGIAPKVARETSVKTNSREGLFDDLSRG